MQDNVYAATFQKDSATLFMNSRNQLITETLLTEKKEMSELRKYLATKNAQINPITVTKDDKGADEKISKDDYKIRQKNPIYQNRFSEQQEVISILEITKKQMVNLLKDEQVDDIKLITKELNEKLNNLNQKVNKIQKLSANFLLLDSLFPNEKAIGEENYQWNFPSSVSEKQYQLNNLQANSSAEMLAPTTEISNGFFGILLQLPTYIFDLKNLFFLSLGGVMVIGFLKGLKFFLNNTW